MYCTSCGVPVAGRYCGECGVAVATPSTPSPLTQDWSQSFDYESLIQIREVRDRIALAAASSSRWMSGEDFLQLCDKFLSPMAGGIPLAKMASIAQPIYGRLGIKTVRNRTEELSLPPGESIVRVLCSLARLGQEIRSVEQKSNGCVIVSTIPSDLASFAGEMMVNVTRADRGTSVSVQTKIPGQLFDWGKSRRCLNRLFDDLKKVGTA